jgi:ABC-type multidrug transport system ATPase subunit
MKDLAISVRGLSKRYGKVLALDNINLDIPKGQIFGLIGPDGAGKTTLIRIMNTLLLPDQGRIEVLGLEVVQEYRAIRKLFGYVPGRFSLYQDLTVEENLELFASIFDTTIEENYELIRPVYSQIEPFKKRLAGALSGGMKQKLALSCALIHKPELLFLDEPTTGVDPVSRQEFWEMLNHLKQEGLTIIASTPYMDEANLCDRIALMQNGKILSIDIPDTIRNQFKKQLFAIKSSNKGQLLQDLESYPQTDTVYPFGEFLHYTDKEGNPDRKRLESYLMEKGHQEILIEPVEPGIEDQFIALMNSKTADHE